jgi:hypothetical protein
MPHESNQSWGQVPCDRQLNDVLAGRIDGESRHKRRSHSGRNKADDRLVVIAPEADSRRDSVRFEEALRVRLGVTKADQRQVRKLAWLKWPLAGGER